MKTLTALLLCCTALISHSQGRLRAQESTGSAASIQATSAPSTSASGDDAAKEAAIRNMFQTIGTAKIMEKILAATIDNMRPVLMSSLPQGEYRDKLIDLFFKRFQSKLRVDQLMDLAVPIYSKYFSKDEIEAITKFYQTPLGQKALSVLPQTVVEMQTASMKFGERVGRESMIEVLDENPDLKKALEQAAGTPKN